MLCLSGFELYYRWVPLNEITLLTWGILEKNPTALIKAVSFDIHIKVPSLIVVLTKATV